MGKRSPNFENPYRPPESDATIASPHSVQNNETIPKQNETLDLGIAILFVGLVIVLSCVISPSSVYFVFPDLAWLFATGIPVVLAGIALMVYGARKKAKKQ